MEAYIKLINNKVGLSYTFEKSKNLVQKKINISGNIESDIQFLKDKKIHKIKYGDVTLKKKGLDNFEESFFHIYLAC